MAAKVVGLGFVGFLVAPFIVATIQGLIGLAVAAVISLLLVNVGVPWFAVKMANWRLKALKHEASLNPIETLENQYGERVAALEGIRVSLKEFFSVVQELADTIKQHEEAYPGKPSQFNEKYQKMKLLYAQRAEKYKQAKANLKDFSDLIDEKRSDWKVAQAFARANKLANVGEDFQSKLMQDTALSSIQDNLNFAFSELEVSLLDEERPAQVTAPAFDRQPAAITAKHPMPELVFDLEPAAPNNYTQS